MKLLLICASFVSAVSASAESLECKGKGISLRASPSIPPTVQETLTARLKTGLLSRPLKLTLKKAPRAENLNYVDYWNPSKLWLSLGSYRGAGQYAGATLLLDRGTPKERTIAVECSLSGEVNFKNFCEKTPENDPQANLFQAVRTGNQDLLEATLPCGVDVEAEDELGCTPLLRLTDRHCGSGKYTDFTSTDIKEMVRLLLQAGASHDYEDPMTGETPLHKVARLQDLESAVHLLNAGADVNAQDDEGYTALMRAVEERSYRMVETFVQRNADPEIENNAGETASDLAQKLGFKRIADLLASKNAVTIQGDEAGVCTPMHIELKLGVSNRIILKTRNPMLMLESSELGINLMAGSGMDAKTTVTPTKAGTYKMSCGPNHGPGNAQGTIVVK